MPRRHRPNFRGIPSLSFFLLLLLLATLCAVGGASRPDVLGQVVVRGICWASLAIVAIFAAPPDLKGLRPVIIFLSLALALALIQLIPLPPAIWQMLPGRAPFLEAAVASGQVQPWRPLSIVPGATENAAASLVVPFATLIFVAGLKDEERAWLPSLILGLITASTLVGLVQFSGTSLENPLINDSPGEVGGTFANRNHFALFIAFGCLLAPVWAFSGGRHSPWRGLVAVGLILLFALTILATGSRAGMVLGFLAVAIGLTLSRGAIKRMLSNYPKWVFPALIGGIVAAIALLVGISVAADRAVSIDRAFAIDPGEDMRGRGLSTVLAMVREYFPFGSGLGSFDPIFRMHEPFALLKPTYFNRAHDDLLEIVLDAGLPGLLLLLAAIAWWAVASVRAWRAGSGSRHALPRTGSAMLLLVLLASCFDYPARTPMMMAMIVIGSIWLSGGALRQGGSALPMYDQHL